MNTNLSGKTILVTGGAGSIGSEIVKQILELKANRVIIFSRDEIKHFLIKKRLSDDRLETVIGDIRDYGSIRRVFEREDIDLIYHAAAMKHVVVCENFPIECANTNINGTQNIVDLAIAYKIPKMITISTDKSVYPINAMGATKLIAERITLNANYSCVRFGNVANSRGSVIPILIDNLLNRKPLCITDPNATRFLISIPDAVRLVLKATEYSIGNDIFILKMKSFRLGDLQDVLINRIAPKLNIDEDDIKIFQTGLVYGEKLHEHLVSDAEIGKLCSIEDMYVILNEAKKMSKYSDIHKVDIGHYTSLDAELISKNELEEFVEKYLEGSLNH